MLERQFWIKLSLNTRWIFWLKATYNSRLVLAPPQAPEKARKMTTAITSMSFRPKKSLVLAQIIMKPGLSAMNRQVAQAGLLK